MDNILHPELDWVDGRCYRKILPPRSARENIESEDLYPIQPNEYVKKKKENELSNEDVPHYIHIEHEGTKFWTTFPIPGPLIGFVVGKQQATRRKIEQTTDTKIDFPDRDMMKDKDKKNVPGKSEKEEENIMIKGYGKNDVTQAVRQVLNILYECRWKVGEFTHFVSIPINNSKIQKNFNDFKKDVLTTCNRSGQLKEDMFEPPSRFHMTLCMLLLFNDRERENATEILMQQKNDILNILGKKKLRVEIKGLEYMNDDPSEVDVLYGKVIETDGDNSLQIIADNIDSAFATANFARRRPETLKVKLHVTLIKSRSGRNGQRESFDARKLLQKYEDFSFGETTVSEIHISIRYTKNEQTGYYRNFCVLKLDSTGI